MISDYMQRGIAAAQARNAREALGWFRKAVAQAPDDPSAKAWLGQTLCFLGKRLDGIAYLRQAAHAVTPPPAGRDISKSIEVIGQLQQWGDFEGSLDICRLAVQAAPDDVRGYQMLAVACGQLNLTAEALAAGERALQLDPDQPMMQVLQGSLEADAGQNEQARRRLEAVIAKGAPHREAFRAHKELARVVNSLGDHDAVFPHIEAAATLAPELLEFRSNDPRILPGMVDTNYTGFDQELLGRWKAADFVGETRPPAFILGFYRSGTTLTQEVLATHPDVLVADEAGLIGDMKRELDRMDPSPVPTHEKLRRLDLAGVKRLRQYYWALARGRYGDDVDRQVFIDKFTMNTLDVGVINCVFPDARIVFMMRDPRDVCLSCVMQLMVPTPATIHLLTWRGTAAFYAMVMDWWLHVRELLTLEVIEVRYEDAVADFEPTYRRVFEFLGLTWDPAAIDFHLRAAGKFIASPSRNQVSRPLYASSVARWRRFESHYAEINDLLDPFLTDFGYPA